MKAKKENKLGSAADGECTDLNGIGDDEHDFDGRNFHDDDHEDFLRTIMILVLTIKIAGGSSHTSEQGDLSRDGLSGTGENQIIIRWLQNKTSSPDAGKSPAPHHQNQDLNGKDE